MDTLKLVAVNKIMDYSERQWQAWYQTLERIENIRKTKLARELSGLWMGLKKCNELTTHIMTHVTNIQKLRGDKGRVVVDIIYGAFVEFTTEDGKPEIVIRCNDVPSVDVKLQSDVNKIGELLKTLVQYNHTLRLVHDWDDVHEALAKI